MHKTKSRSKRKRQTLPHSNISSHSLSKQAGGGKSSLFFNGATETTPDRPQTSIELFGITFFAAAVARLLHSIAGSDQQTPGGWGGTEGIFPRRWIGKRRREGVVKSNRKDSSP
ncbi:hypothetical protein NPIL_365411 [Nephila pilipes]|uniref:Uncharacterized protein n=1 Tax=Nephila pilipes TaxID=299642 RepID=A0A8X6QPB7_NEPPI|nr:hypothetical protein NPIL_365411 [Nephila pilipes]